MNLKNLPEVLTYQEVAKLFRISPITLKRWGNNGTIKYFTINRRGDRRYLKTEVERILNQVERVSHD